MDQYELLEARQKLGLKPVEMARIIGANYGTFKKWQNGQRKMGGTSSRCIELLLAIKGTETGKRFGV